MGAMASQITSLTIVYSTVCSDANKRKYQSSASLAFVRGIHRWPVNSPHKWPVTREMFPFDDVIMLILLGQVVYIIDFCVTKLTDDILLNLRTRNCHYWGFKIGMLLSNATSISIIIQYHLRIHTNRASSRNNIFPWLNKLELSRSDWLATTQKAFRSIVWLLVRLHVCCQRMYFS